MSKKRFLILRVSRIIFFVLLILSFAAVILSLDFYLKNSRRLSIKPHTIITFPITFKSGSRYSKDFIMNENCNYEVRIIFKHLLSTDLLDSLIGHWNRISAISYPAASLPLSVILRNEDSLIFKKDSVDELSFSNSEGQTDRIIRSFMAVRGKHYHLTVRINKDIPELNKTNPEIKVSPNPVVYKNDMIDNILAAEIAKFYLRSAGIFFVIILIINLILLVIWRRKSARSLHP